MYDLRQLNQTQLERLWHHVWDRMTKYDGWQPFGYDTITLQLTKPGWWQVLCAIKAEGCRRLHS